MKYYKLRIDTINHQDVKDLLEKYSPDCWVYSREKTGTLNEHVHCYLETRSNSATIRTQIRRKFGSGNGKYSLKELDEQRPIEYMAYIIKDNVFFYHNIDDFTIVEYQEYNMDVVDEMKRKKNSRKTQLETLKEKAEETPGQIDSIESCVDFVVQYYKDTGKLVRKFQIISLAQTLALKYVPEYEHSLSASIYSLM